MSEISAPGTLAELRRDFIHRAREEPGSTATNAIADRFLNIALQDMHNSPGANRPWAERSAVLITRAPYTTGTVDITTAVSRTAVTGNSTLWTTTDSYGLANARAGGKIKFGNSEIYEVASVGGAGTMTLATAYTGSDLDDDTYTYFEDEYSLAADFRRFIDMRYFSQERNIQLIGRSEFRSWRPRNDIAGKPLAATLIQKVFSGSTTPAYRVVLGPPPSTAESIPYTYITTYLAVSSAGVAQVGLSADDDEPIVPLQFRQAIVLHALYHYYRDRKDDARSQEVKAEYTDFMVRTLGDTEIGQDRPRFMMRRQGNGGRRGRFDSSTGRFSWDLDW
jgi:hypothetical protein